MKRHHTVMISASAIVVSSLVAAIFFYPAFEDKQPQAVPNTTMTGLTPPALQSNPVANVVAEQPPGKDASRAQEKTKTQRLNTELVDKNLASVKLDEHGELVLGPKQKQQLEAAFKHMNYDMSEAQLNKLQTYIKTQLSGEAGDKVATVVRNYYDFKVAERDIMGQMTTSGIDSIQSNYDQIVQTRIAILGPEVNEQLFGKEQRKEQFMIDSMLLESDTSLSTQEREQRKKALLERYYQ